MAAIVLFFLALMGGGAGWVELDRTERRAESAARIDSALQETSRLRDQKSWSEASAAAQRADVLLGEGPGHSDLRQRLNDLVKDLQMVERLEQVAEGQLMELDGFWDHAGADSLYEAAFREYGIDVTRSEVADAANRVQASAIAEQLMSALDDWAWVSRRNTSRCETVRAVVCLSDPDPWRIRFRDPGVQQNRRALEELATRPEVASQPPTIVAYLGRALNETGGSDKAAEVLTAAQRRHPDHFWLNLYLGTVLRWGVKPPRHLESASYMRAALALRPQALRVHLELGGSLLSPDHADEAIVHFRRALEIRPDYAHPHHSIGCALALKGAWEEAIESYRTCLQGNVEPRLAVRVHYDLGKAYSAIDDLDNAT
jgi:tetratricopeptide (TPR) repeat protein